MPDNYSVNSTLQIKKDRIGRGSQRSMDCVCILICHSGQLNELGFILLKQEKASMLRTNATIATNYMIWLQYILQIQ